MNEIASRGSMSVKSTLSPIDEAPPALVGNKCCPEADFMFDLLKKQISSKVWGGCREDGGYLT